MTPHRRRGLATVQFGVTDLCNYRCAMCPQTAHEGLYGAPERRGPVLHGGRRGFMDPALFARALDGCAAAAFPLGIVSLVWLGEPLLHPDFPDLLDAALAFGEATGLAEAVVFNTNGSLLTPELSGRIVARYARAAGRCRGTITFSIDAASPAVYAALKPGADWGTTLANLRAFAARFARARAAGDLPLVALFQMIVLRENAHEAAAFRDLFASMLAEEGIPFDVGVSAFGECAGEAPARIVYKLASTENQAEMSELFHRTVAPLGLAPPPAAGGDAAIMPVSPAASPGRRRACPAVFDSAIVDWDGGVTPCCADSEMELRVGSLAESALHELYDGTSWRDLRRAHETGDLAGWPRCAACAATMRERID